MSPTALLFLELGGILFGLAVLARFAGRLGISPIPLYLLGGLAFGEGGLVPVFTSRDFIEVGAQLGVVLLLFMLGMEYSGDELTQGLKSGAAAGTVDLIANFVPGFLAGLVIGLGPLDSLFLGGITYISSSGVVAKLLADLGWTGNRETPIVLSILVFEDLAMAMILPILGAVALGGSLAGTIGSVVAALALVGVILAIASRHGDQLSRVAFSGTNEVNLLTVLGVTLIVAGLAEQIHISAAVGAFLVGLGVSGDAANRLRGLLLPLRDLFAGIFFVFFGLSIDPTALPQVAGYAIALALLTGASKAVTGWWAARRAGISIRGRRRAATILLARGEFSIIIAGLGISAGVDARLGPIAAGYVLVMAAAGPLLARLAAQRTAA
ncbi:MAG: cation:proton antiporter [Acidimicrobiia bacterium]